MIQLSKKLNINKKFIFLGSLSFLLISLKFSNPIFIQKISNINYDFYQSKPIKGKIDNITIIDIDEKSISKIGQFPWRRDVYATIFKNLKAARLAADIADVPLIKMINRTLLTYYVGCKKKIIISPHYKLLILSKSLLIV